MKKHLLRSLLAAFALLLVCGNVWGETQTATLSISATVTENTTIKDSNAFDWAVTSDGTYTGNKAYIQAGTNKSEVTYLKLTSSAFEDVDITKVQVWGTSKANTGVTAKVYINGTKIGESEAYTVQNSSSGGTEFAVENTNAVKGGDLVIEISREEASTGAVYFNKAIITYNSGTVLATHTLSYAVTPEGAGTVELASTSVVEGATTTATAVANEGYSFDSWSITGTGASITSSGKNVATITMGTSDATVTASFTKLNKYTVTCAEAQNGTISADKTNPYQGDKVTITATPATGYELRTLTYVEDVEGATETDIKSSKSFTMPNANVTVTATFGEAALNEAFDLSKDETTTATEEEISWDGTIVSIIDKKEKSTTKTNNYYPGTTGQSYTSTRFYTKSVLTITPKTGYYIQYIEFDATTTGYASALNNSTWTNATSEAKEKLVTVTPTDGFAAISATIGGTCGFTAIRVYYTTGTPETVSVTGVELDQTTATLEVGGTVTLKATVLPANATNKNVTWKSDNEAVATVADGVVTAVASGSANITVTTVDGGKTATCAVSVPAITGDKTTLTVGTNGNTTWTNAAVTSSATVDNVTFTAIISGGNDGKYYTSDNSWRFYVEKKSGIEIAVANDLKITKLVVKWKSGQPVTPNGFTESTKDNVTTFTADEGTAANKVLLLRGTANMQIQTIDVYYDDAPNTVAAPTFSLEAGEYNGTQSLTISCATSGATIYYSTDATNYTAYTGSISLEESCMVFAYATKDGITGSTVYAAYTINAVYESLAALVASGTPTTTGRSVIVNLTDEVIAEIYVTKAGKRNGVYVWAGEHAVELFCSDVPEDWFAGGTLSYTNLVGTWKLYNETWEIVIDSWDGFTYTAPVFELNCVKDANTGKYFASYYASNSMVLEEGVVVYGVTASGSTANFYEYEGETVIPAGAAVILVSDHDDIALTPTSKSCGEYELDSYTNTSINALIGFDEDTEIEGSESVKYYALNYKAVDAEKMVGFFAPKGAGTPNGSFTAKANKAYLKVKDQTAANSLDIRFGGTTMVEQMLMNSENTVIYDLLGRKVENATKGIYIVNGKKVCIK